MTTLLFVACTPQPQKVEPLEPSTDVDLPDNTEIDTEALSEGDIIGQCVPLDGFTICGVNLADATEETLGAATNATPYDESIFQGNFGFSTDSAYAFTVDGYSEGQSYLVSTADAGYVALFVQNYIMFIGDSPDMNMGLRPEYSFAVRTGDSLEKIAPILALEDGEYDSPYGKVKLTKEADNQNYGNIGTKKLMYVGYPGANVTIKIFYDESGIFYVEPLKSL